MPRKSSRPPTNNLRAWRKDRDVTLKVLGEAADTTASIISDLEAGEINLSDRWLVRLADALNKLAKPGQIRATGGRILDHTPDELRGDLFAEADATPDDLRPEAVRFLRYLRRDAED